MQVLGIGIDLVEVDRIQRAAARPGFLERVYTAGERAAGEASAAHRYRRLAARFAAKEAALKALGTGLRGGSWVEIEVVNDPLGKPELVLHGAFAELAAARGIRQLLVTLSHTEHYATAQVLALGGDGDGR